MKYTFAIALALAACAPPDRSGSVNAWMYVRDESTNGYSLEIAQVDNLESLRELRGRDVELRAATSISEGLSEESLVIDRGREFAFDWSEEPAGVVVPADRDSFQALSLYRNLDRVATLLRAHGHVPSRRLVVFYLPRYDNVLFGDGRLLLTDNAAYMSLARAFLILPSFMLSDLPMLLNEGVVAHEYGHAVIHQELFGDATEEPHAGSKDEGWRIAARHLQAMHEGVADIIGFVATGDANFILPTADVDRDMAIPRDLTDELARELTTLPTTESGLAQSDGYDPHEQGSILARAVYELWPKGTDGRIDANERGRMLDATLKSLRALRYEKETFTLASFPNELVRRLGVDEVEPACVVLRKRLAPLVDRLTACAGGT